MTTARRELSPRALAHALEPDWRFDERVVGEWTLTDIYPGDATRLIVELRAGTRRLRLTVAPSLPGDRPSVNTAAGLSIAWMQPASSDAGKATCDAIRDVLARSLGAGPTAWEVPPAAELLVPDACRDEIRVEDAPIDADPDAQLLCVDAVHYERLFGTRPRGKRVTFGEQAHGVSIDYPAPTNGTLPPSGALYSVPTRFHRRPFRAYFAALGCVFDGGFPRTVPTPTTLDRAVRALLGHAPPLRPRLLRGAYGAISARAWTRRVAFDSVLPVAVAPRWAVEVHRVARRAGLLARVPVDVGMLAHDVSLHALGVHAVDEGWWATLLERARARLRWAHIARVRRLAAFFEGTLTRTAWEVWREVDAPEDFSAAFAQRAGELDAALDDT